MFPPVVYSPIRFDGQLLIHCEEQKMATRKAAKESKMTIATQLFKKYHGKKTRAEIVNLFVEKADLSKAGANTYFEKIKSRQ